MAVIARGSAGSARRSASQSTLMSIAAGAAIPVTLAVGIALLGSAIGSGPNAGSALPDAPAAPSAHADSRTGQ